MGVEEVAKGVLEYKAYVIDGGIPAIEEEKMQYFLDRFYMSRIAIRVLINQHVTMFGDRGSIDNSLVGAFDGKCDLRRVVEDAAQNAQYLCEKYYLGAPEVEIEMVNDRKYIEMGYVPSHLHHICFELFKNSMRATVESHSDTFDVPPIRVLLTKGKDNVCIKISDRRGGDLMLQSVEGYGTDAYIYLKSGTADAVEVLPIFTNQLSDHYKTQRTMKDWVSKQGPISTSQLNTSMSSGGHRKF